MKKKSKKSSNKSSNKTRSSTRDDAADVDESSHDLSDGGSSKGRRVTIDPEEFVRAWTAAGSVAEVADQFGIKPTSATALASRLRKAGVDQLKHFARRSGKPIDARALNKIAKSGG
jgi:hypothetical protein